MNITKLVQKAIDEYNNSNFEESLAIYKRSFSHDMTESQRAIIYRNMGLCHYSMMKYPQAELCFLRAIENRSEEAHWELCLSKLHQGDIKGIELFSYRYFVSWPFPNLPLKKIRHLSELEKADNILVLNEQGFGDEVLFSRGLALLKDKKHSYQVYSQMIDLFRYNFDYNFFDERTLSFEFVNSHDYWIPAGDLFKFQVIKNGYEFLPFKSNCRKHKKVGVCFFSNNTLSIKLVNESRKIDYHELKNILTKYEWEFVNLQKDFVMDFATNHDIGSFLHSAQIIEDLDVVITIDTVIAHLASVMGKKVIIMYKKYIDWRWKLPLYGNEYITTEFDKLDEVLKKIY